MFNHTKLSKKPKQFLSITGLTVLHNLIHYQKKYKNNTKQQKKRDYPKTKENEILGQDDVLITPSKTEF